MKTNHLKSALFAALWLAPLVFSAPLSAGDPPPSERPKIYDEAADGEKLVAEAVKRADKEGKHVLLQFGANWCIWCHRLHGLMESDKALAKELKKDYVVVMVDVNKEHNQGLKAKYKAEKLGLPFLVVLGHEGKHLLTKKSDDLEEGDHHSPEKVMAFLKEWAPK